MPIFFYLFTTLIIISSLCVVLSKNSVYSVLWLIFTFINGSGLMILLGAEFLAMLLIVIYVGAVAVLFLFVIMMLDINFNQAITKLRENLSLSIFITLIMFADLVITIILSTKNINYSSNISFAIANNISNTKAIGNVLYTEFMLPFQIAGLILFVAMISCITLTLKKRDRIKHQDIRKQLSHNKSNVILMTKPILNKGVENIKYE
ncbi:NADH:ubiquinone oxidoreductase subunit J [Rickettsia prowazekii str. GvV257]|uniref:NADH-quinone oxidoreductase subunit J n=2 Tax=Rickettsia prowazekii TaxID=782 RepID=NUOJ_RICPR|nr:NADH-quinone oxidoreductase subunit J [Rickettsia prowazekii]Q9ZCG3.1 RecName: Full=NADH-quinone oxidoreductase subunit J; AltName: Full=NADH dehydrogenase I subunit J; AltName: Full=NDH-1 subunit J [Rickettsia prowazekii str. Madrid E]EOB10288.1 NADH-ubiquinone oxidoreductase, chain 4L [Rickettsia prowazekii str. GvF12]ADE30354.1 NADH dehydrogenase I chain J [Rickettsia prowazekii str. Rp22]AFE49585.1 NADH:ubiquinone oxidoreductase subunit J [Rickettsia prowazekii str. Chernikova]AFE50429.